ncbi:MAG: LLM class flavin-dependent oxidoreductase [Chloroflexia bacterium]
MPNPNISFGWFTPSNSTPQSNRVPLPIWQQSEVLPAVARHFDSLWVSDHFIGFDNLTTPFLECWTTLTWLASRYPNVQVGTIVLAVGWRNPALLAKMAASLHALSNGRVIMGIGAGWREVEYDSYGYPFPKPSIRIAQLEEAVKIMHMMWTESAPTFHGNYFQIENAYCYPQPNPPIPMMIGGGGEQLLLPLAARNADIWDVYHGGNHDTFDLQNYTRKLNILRTAAEAANRKPSAIKQSVTIGEARLPTSSQESAQWLDSLRPIIDLGVTQFILDCAHVPSAEPVERFAEEVIRPLRS